MEVTDRKRMQEALEATVQNLERSYKELEQFAYVCAHDLQQPLRQVRSFVQLLQKRCAEKLDGTGEEYLAYISSGAQRMAELITGVLEYSRVGWAETPWQVTPCEQLLAAAVSDLGAAVAETGAQITHDALPAVRGRPTQLTQLFQNLIGNAIKFRREGVAPHIHIGWQQEVRGSVFSVIDNGIGIPEQDHARVFRMFQRLHTAERYEGTGIGLAICQKIVEAHGGKIWIEHQNRQGTAFCFTLPTEGEPCVMSADAAGS
jgi:light-regulated signal transduction histidine kinase (bacteriophytochrome)